jgi:Ca-activated chloride channel family protein
MPVRSLVFAFAALIACAAAPVFAQDVRIAPPTVWIAPAPGLQPVRLDSVSIDVGVAGFIARTRMELVFDNPNDRVLEGEFVFPLGAGQTVAGYELDVDGRLRAGVVVPKETARVAFEDITRQQVDPGLAELTQGNVFRTRLYPIPARGQKRIALTFEQSLLDAGNEYRYVLPLSFDRPVRRFKVNAQADVGPAAVSGDGQSPDPQLRFERSHLAWVAGFEQSDITPRSELAFTLPKVPGTPVLEAADPLEPAWRSVVARIDTGLPEKAIAGLSPDRVAIFYDASGSAHSRDRERELAAIDGYLRNLGDADVTLIPFRNELDTPTSHRVIAGDAKPLIDAIRALPLDGGSSYGAIDTAAARGAGVILIVGDGLSNFGGHEARFASPASVVNVIHAAQQADHARLARIARRGGGRVIDLLQVTADQAAADLSSQPWQLRSIASWYGRCQDMSPQTPDAVGASVTVTARCRGRATMTLTFGRRGDADVTRTIDVGEASPVTGVMADSVHRLWAQSHIATLDASPQADRDAIVAVGTRYGVVSRYTSLLVLDRIEDYVRYGIEPKDDDLRAAYRVAIANQPKPTDVDPGRVGRIQALAALWQEFRQWHGTRHPWLETILVPVIDNEAARWELLARSDGGDRKRVDDRMRVAKKLGEDSRALSARWLTDGADPATRVTWEREAAALMQRMRALRQERIALAPGSDGDDGDGEILTSPMEAETMGDEARLDRREVGGAPVDTVLAEPLPPPPSPSTPAAQARSAPQEMAFAAPAGVATNAGSAPSDAGVSATASIELRGWNPETPYLKAIRGSRDAYAAYLGQRETHGDTPAFFLDTADYFRDEAKDPALALRVLSNIAEISIENTELTRVLAYRLAQWDRHTLAVGQFEYALEQRPEEPQSYRDLALALSRQPRPDVARAIELLWTVATRDWHGRFPEIELIALHELNAILATAPDDSDPGLALLGIPAELIDPLAVGLRVVMTWDADNTDIDLWVIDPAGEKAFYGAPRTQTGGRISRDFTQGYGPEVFVIRRPLPGAYRVQANYFGDRRQSLTGPVTVQIEFQTRFGEALAERQAITRRLESGREVIDLGEFVVELE